MSSKNGPHAAPANFVEYDIAPRCGGCRNLRFVRLAMIRQFKEADQLLQKHALTVRLRTLDSLQLATAIELRTRHMLDHFVCADATLCKIAADEGLSVIDPET